MGLTRLFFDRLKNGRSIVSRWSRSGRSATNGTNKSNWRVGSAMALMCMNLYAHTRMKPRSDTRMRSCASLLPDKLADFGLAVLHEQQVDRLLQQLLDGGAVLGRQNFELARDLGVEMRADEPLAFAHRPVMPGRLGFLLPGLARRLGARLWGHPLTDLRCGRRIRALAGGRLFGAGC